MNFCRVKQLTRRSAAVLSLILCNLLLSSPIVAALETHLLIYTTDAVDTGNAPGYAAEAYSVGIAARDLEQSVIGDYVQIQLPAGRMPTLEIKEISHFINGDLVYRAQGEDASGFYSLVLTLGQRSLYGHLSSSIGSFQIVASPVGDSFQGWLYKPVGLSGDSGLLQNDYVIPDKSIQVVRPVNIQPDPLTNALPLTLNEESDSGSDISTASQGQIDVSNFRISQQFSRRAVQVNQTVSVQVLFENISSEWHQGLGVDFYFVLENSFLESAGSNCRAELSLSLQEVLHCDLGNFAPGESKYLEFSILATRESGPTILNTAIMGNLRSDAYVNVVEDVRTDSDADGISDFNEVLIGTDPDDPLSLDSSNVIIDVMAFYTPGAAALYPGGVETRINQLVSVANQVYADSGIGITLRPVFHGLVDYNDEDDMDTALSHIVNRTDPAFADVDSLRQVYGGDLVMLFRPLGLENGKCGLANVGGLNTEGDFDADIEKDYAYSHIGIDCPTDLVVAHELGHNMGLTHSHLEDGSGGTFNFSTGYGVDSGFATIMAFPAAFNTDVHIARFSDPRIDCLGFICGRNADDEFGADAVQSLNLVKYQIANYYPATVPQLPGKSVASASGGQTDASIAIAASIDNGMSFVQSVSPVNNTDISAEIYVDSRHVGLEGVFHVLLTTTGSGDIWQLEQDGNLGLWDGTVEGLKDYSELRSLRKIEHLYLINNYRFDESLVGVQLSIYIAYQVPGLRELIYTTEPLAIAIELSP